MARLLLLFVLVPIAELALLIEIGRHVGLLPTLGLIVATGVLGTWLARRQGLGVLAQVRGEMAAGRLPAGALVDGALILVAGAVLMTPGVLTDAFGFFCLVPAGRRLLKRSIQRRLEAAVRRGRAAAAVRFGGAAGADPWREVKNVTPDPGPEPPTREEPDRHGGR